MSDPMIPVGWFEGLVGVVMAGLTGWITRLEIKAASNTDRIREVELDLAKNYHTKAELKETLRDALEPVRDALIKMETKLDDLGRR